MALTSPDEIWTPDASDDYALTTDLAATADSVQLALNKKANYGVGTTAERTAALADFPDGAVWFDTTLESMYRRVSGAWVEDNSGGAYNYIWANSAARAAESGMVTGEKGFQTDTGVVYRYNGSAWKAWESDWITYTATLSASSGTFAVGTGGLASNVTKYRYKQGTVEVWFSFVLGTSGQSMGTTPKFTLPVASATPPHPYTLIAVAGDVFDTSATAIRFLPIVSENLSTTVVRMGYMDNISGLIEYPTASTPWLWAAGDALQGTFSYTPA